MNQLNFDSIINKELEQQVIELSKSITDAANELIPKNQFDERTKPWWNEELNQLRHEMAS